MPDQPQPPLDPAGVAPGGRDGSGYGASPTPLGDYCRVTILDEGDRVVVSVAGEVDVASGQQLRDCLFGAVDSSPAVVVDLAGVEFMDSTGLNALVAALNRARQQGCELSVRRPRPQVRRLFGISGLDLLLTVEPVEGQ